MRSPLSLHAHTGRDCKTGPGSLILRKTEVRLGPRRARPTREPWSGLPGQRRPPHVLARPRAAATHCTVWPARARALAAKPRRPCWADSAQRQARSPVLRFPTAYLGGMSTVDLRQPMADRAAPPPAERDEVHLEPAVYKHHETPGARTPHAVAAAAMLTTTRPLRSAARVLSSR